MNPILIFNLLNKTPLKTNSSKIGAKIIEVTAVYKNAVGVNDTESISIMLIHVGSLIPIRVSKTTIENKKRYAKIRFIANWII